MISYRLKPLRLPISLISPDILIRLSRIYCNGNPASSRVSRRRNFSVPSFSASGSIDILTPEHRIIGWWTRRGHRTLTGAELRVADVGRFCSIQCMYGQYCWLGAASVCYRTEWLLGCSALRPPRSEGSPVFSGVAAVQWWYSSGQRIQMHWVDK